MEKVKVNKPKVKKKYTYESTSKKQTILRKSRVIPDGYVRMDKNTNRIYHIFASSGINAGDIYINKHANYVKKLKFNEHVKIPKISKTMRKKVIKVLNESTKIDSMTKQKRHYRWWYYRDGVVCEVGSMARKFFTAMERFSKMDAEFKKQIFLDYQGGNGVPCLYLNKMGFTTYCHDVDNAEAIHLLTEFKLDDMVVEDRNNLFKYNTRKTKTQHEPFTAAMAMDWSLNDRLGKPITEIKSLKYIVLNEYGIAGSPTDRRGIITGSPDIKPTYTRDFDLVSSFKGVHIFRAKRLK